MRTGETKSGIISSLRSVLTGAACVAALSGCMGSDTTGSIGNLVAFNSATPPAVAGPVALRVECPEVQVQDGAGTVRTFAGRDQSSSSVRYQFGISETARECDVVNGQIAIKVGVSGRVLIGPAGQPGTYAVALRVAVKRDGTDGVAATKVYPVSATIPAGETGADFTVVSDQLMVPYTREEAGVDYTILVGFDEKAAVAKPHAAPKKKKG